MRVSAAGNRTDRANLRVATLISIWFMAHLPSQSSAIYPSQLGRACSLSSKLRSIGRSISILPPWKPILPFAFPQRCARLGLAAGAGLEYGITQNLSAKGEWIWIGAGAGNTLKDNLLRVGLNWRFGM